MAMGARAATRADVPAYDLCRIHFLVISSAF
jgi:hypothetical protein